MTPKEAIMNGYPFYALEVDEIIRRLTAAGYVIVPKEPTHEMVAAGAAEVDHYDRDYPEYAEARAVDAYCAMIGAYT